MTFPTNKPVVTYIQWDDGTVSYPDIGETFEYGMGTQTPVVIRGVTYNKVIRVWKASNPDNKGWEFSG